MTNHTTTSTQRRRLTDAELEHVCDEARIHWTRAVIATFNLDGRRHARLDELRTQHLHGGIMIATSSDLARVTVHHCNDIIGTDEFGDVLGPTSCGIVAGTYGTTRPADVTCNDCIGAMIDSLFTPQPNHQEMTR